MGTKVNYTACLLILLSTSLLAEPPLALVRGEFLETDGSEIVVRLGDHTVKRFRFTKETQVERRGGGELTVAVLKAGEILDVVSVREGAEPWMARLIQAAPVRMERTRAPVPALPEWPRSTALELVLPRGRLTLSGIVLDLKTDSMLVRTREGERQRVVIRRDTRFRRQGQVAKAADLPEYTQVYVRGGRGLNNEWEAYEVMWGEILNPSAPR